MINWIGWGWEARERAASNCWPGLVIPTRKLSIVLWKKIIFLNCPYFGNRPNHAQGVETTRHNGINEPETSSLRQFQFCCLVGLKRRYLAVIATGSLWTVTMELLATAALWNSYTNEMREWEIFASLSHWLDTTLDWELFLLLILYTTHASGKYLT